ncbi:MAG TPA: hypothetical protein VFC31_14090 [Candidatus Limnocylindria bacterium]|nr:hypothetical protein [Candidatus Limnocylindria bacterium]
MRGVYIFDAGPGARRLNRDLLDLSDPAIAILLRKTDPEVWAVVAKYFDNDAFTNRVRALLSSAQDPRAPLFDLQFGHENPYAGVVLVCVRYLIRVAAICSERGEFAWP